MFKKYNLQSKKYLYSTLAGLVLLGLSLIINFFASTYASKEASNAVSDILLDHLPVFNVSFVFIEGAVSFIFFIFFLLARRPITLPYILKSVALFVFIRAIAVTLTHIAPAVNRSAIYSGEFTEKFVFDGDLFFSGHTGLPFLFALNYWKNLPLRYFFLFCSVVGATASILGHLHYTIDVFAAYFITYTIFQLSKKFFADDYHFFQLGLEKIVKITD